MLPFSFKFRWKWKEYSYVSGSFPHYKSFSSAKENAGMVAHHCIAIKSLNVGIALTKLSHLFTKKLSREAGAKALVAWKKWHNQTAFDIDKLKKITNCHHWKSLLLYSKPTEPACNI